MTLTGAAIVSKVFTARKIDRQIAIDVVAVCKRAISSFRAPASTFRIFETAGILFSVFPSMGVVARQSALP